MKKIKFKNKPNELVKTIDNEAYWISRANVIIGYIKNNDKILIVRRGPHVSNTGKWCLPCGYLDWNETINEALVREVYEESSVYLKNYINTDNLTHELNSKPQGYKQNVSFWFYINLDGNEDIPIEKSLIDKNEITDVKWITIEEVKNYNFVFNHDNIIIDNFDKF